MRSNSTYNAKKIIFFKFLDIENKKGFFLPFGPNFCLISIFQSPVQYALLTKINNIVETSYFGG